MTATHAWSAEDDAAVRNVLGLAAFLNDQGEPDDQRKVWAPDVVWHMSIGDVTRVGADAMVAAAEARRSEGLLGPGSGVRHFMTQLTTELTGDTATAVSYWVCIKDTSIVSSGTYHDDLIRTEAGWRIARRDIVIG